ncbi:unnamed protein product [Rhizoctonia solani]|uniref:Uncharacterized protein n=1 Tax=Rhizoctonia solani TaxID=456999 RepID=A0A8H3GQ65_9AGAM|nr:unnamed protein product [Rhizoctonia solani]
MKSASPHGSTQTTDIRSLQHGITDVANRTRGQVTNLAPIFPQEIFEHITDDMFALDPPPKDYNGSLHSSKPYFTDVHGFMGASPILHEMGIIRWVSVLTIRDPKDWEVALKWRKYVRLVMSLSRSHHIAETRASHGLYNIHVINFSELICMEGAFHSNDSDILQQFSHLHTVTIDCHSDVYKNASGRFSYRDVFTSLPASILRLEITCAHGPDLKIMETVRTYCPRIEALRLGRCTMFNRSSPCEFWLNFPFDHDAYMASDGTDDYAHLAAQEMASLSQLKHLRLGVYLIPSTTVLAHRAYHVRKEAAPAPVNWQQALIDATHDANGPPEVSKLVELYYRAPAMEAEFGPDSCTFCRDSFYNQSNDFQRSASAVMKTVVPSLEMIEWMDWFTPFHRGVSRHDVRPPQGATGP